MDAPSIPNLQAPTPTAKTIRVLLIDDSPLALNLMQRMLASAPDMEVVGTAHNGWEALRIIPDLKPTVICTDYYMPVMDGLRLTQEVMAKYPCPILVVSSIEAIHHKEEIFALLQAGAVDTFPKPTYALEADPKITQQLVSRIRLLSGVPVVTRRAPLPAIAEPAVVSAVSAAAPQSPRQFMPKANSQAIAMVAVGASTGGPQALQQIFSQLPANFPVPILCAQHISEGFLQGLVDWLDTQCILKVQVARSGDKPLPGVIYFPQEKTHLEVDPRGYLVASHKPPIDGHRPSVTATFKSVAEHYGEAALGVLLTGMGRDGADGMQAIAQAGGITMAQDEASSIVFGMPQQAIALGAVHHIVAISEMAPAIMKYVAGRK